MRISPLKGKRTSFSLLWGRRSHELISSFELKEEGDKKENRIQENTRFKQEGLKWDMMPTGFGITSLTFSVLCLLWQMWSSQQACHLINRNYQLILYYIKHSPECSLFCHFCPDSTFSHCVALVFHAVPFISPIQYSTVIIRLLGNFSHTFLF